MKRAGLFPAVRELTVFEFKTSHWIANRADVPAFWPARWGGEERVSVGRACGLPGEWALGNRGASLAAGRATCVLRPAADL